MVRGVGGQGCHQRSYCKYSLYDQEHRVKTIIIKTDTKDEQDSFLEKGRCGVETRFPPGGSQTRMKGDGVSLAVMGALIVEIKKDDTEPYGIAQDWWFGYKCMVINPHTYRRSKKEDVKCA